MTGRRSFAPAVAPPKEQDRDSLSLAFRGNRLLILLIDGRARLPTLADIDNWSLPILRSQYLGRLAKIHCYSMELAEECVPPAGWTFKGLRGLYGALPEDEFWLAAAAVQIVDWDRTHQYCGRCGTVTHDKSRERAKECPNCGLTSYPRISPAIIVLVQRGDQLLLARSWRHPADLFSVLAGFVEPGETLEEAVRREVCEEVGIEVQDITYFGSQPWPFPNSLMIAFTCHYASGEIALNEEEMREAGWFTAETLPRVPPKLSIARQLIDWFVAQKSGIDLEQVPQKPELEA